MRRTGLGLAALALAVAVAAAACTPELGGPRLHTIDIAPDSACAGVGLEDATLHGSLVDPRVAWVSMRGFGEQQALFPSGFTARFAPSLEVLDATGKVVFREGDKLTGACGASDGALLLLP